MAYNEIIITIVENIECMPDWDEKTKKKIHTKMLL